MNDNSLIARRTLQFTSRDDATLRHFTVGITAPHEVAHAADAAALHDPMSACQIVFEGLPVEPIVVRAADSLQAVQHAADIDPVLRELARERGFVFFWDDGSAYFEPSI